MVIVAVMVVIQVTVVRVVVSVVLVSQFHYSCGISCEPSLFTLVLIRFSFLVSSS